MPETAIIIVNWNGWKDTIECINSFTHPLPGGHFFIIDNNSTDSSIPELEHYFKNHFISYTICETRELSSSFSELNQVTLVKNPTNQGFAGANNAILRFLIILKQFRYAWLLNNDTIVYNDTLTNLIRKIKENDRNAFCGSVLLEYKNPNLVQCCGVKHYKYLGVSKLLRKNENWPQIRSNISLPQKGLFYQNGASLLVDISRLDTIGLMDERFFLYSEEADWQFKALHASFYNVTATESLVQHKGSASTAGKKFIFFYYYNKSAILMTRKNFGLMAGISATLSLTAITIIRAKFNLKSIFFGVKGLLRGWML